VKNAAKPTLAVAKNSDRPACAAAPVNAIAINTIAETSKLIVLVRASKEE